MGFTDKREDITKGDAKVFCGSFNLGSAFITPEYISFEKTCPDYSPTSGANFSGNFKFECGGIENKKGLEILLEYKKNEELMNEFNSIPNENNKNEDGDLGGASANDKRPTNDEMKKLLEEAMNEIKTTQ